VTRDHCVYAPLTTHDAFVHVSLRPEPAARNSVALPRAASTRGVQKHTPQLGDSISHRKSRIT